MNYQVRILNFELGNSHNKTLKKTTMDFFNRFLLRTRSSYAQWGALICNSCYIWPGKHHLHNDVRVNQSIDRVTVNKSIDRVTVNKSIGRVTVNKSIGRVTVNKSIGRVTVNKSIGRVVVL